ncbi:hypothetical protein [Phytohabitans kaempferiae]|uniref:Major facilitator superfamily (MFS) profile domain-containing protein n=1 Tax=Phytohabitans kaempferiae TaxID=1620943 RepID=A0ABV6MFC9_9ACTN
MATMVVVALVGSGAFAGGWALGRWWTIAIGALIALFSVLLMAAGVGSLYKYPESEATETGK